MILQCRCVFGQNDTILASDADDGGDYACMGSKAYMGDPCTLLSTLL